MAKLDFIAGGYRGKLGDTIGERWRSIIYVKAYTIPSDPRTAAQVLVRKKFAKAAKLVDISMQLNPDHKLWRTRGNINRAQRMKEAIANLNATDNETLSIPIIPSNTIPTSTITDISADYKTQGQTTLISETIQNADVHCIIGLYITGTQKSTGDATSIILHTEVFPNSNVIGAILDNDDFELDETSTVTGINEQKYTKDILYFPMQKIKGIVITPETSQTVQNGQMLFNYTQDGLLTIELPENIDIRREFDVTITINCVNMLNGQDIATFTATGIYSKNNKIIQISNSYKYVWAANKTIKFSCVAKDTSAGITLTIDDQTTSLKKKILSTNWNIAKNYLSFQEEPEPYLTFATTKVNNISKYGVRGFIISLTGEDMNSEFQGLYWVNSEVTVRAKNNAGQDMPIINIEIEGQDNKTDATEWYDYEVEGTQAQKTAWSEIPAEINVTENASLNYENNYTLLELPLLQTFSKNNMYIPKEWGL